MLFCFSLYVHRAATTTYTIVLQKNMADITETMSRFYIAQDIFGGGVGLLEFSVCIRAFPPRTAACLE